MGKIPKTVYLRMFRELGWKPKFTDGGRITSKGLTFGLTFENHESFIAFFSPDEIKKYSLNPS